MSTRTAATQRKPLAPLPLEQFLRAAAAASSSSSSPSPKKRSHLTGDMSLLPSPFLASSTPRHASGPLTTLYEAPPKLQRSPGRVPVASPQRRMLARDEEERLGDDEMPVSSPRRLLDLFQASEKRGGGPGAQGGSGSSPVRSMRGSMPPPSPRRAMSPFMGRREEKEEEPAAPTWSFYEDDGETTAPAEDETPTEEDATMSSPIAEEADAVPVDKENNRPPPRRRRSTSLFSQVSTSALAAPSSVPTTTTASTSLVASSNPSPARPPPLPLTLPSVSAPTILEHRPPSPRTPPAVTSSPGFPSYPDLGSTNPLSAFAESAATSFSPVLRQEDGEETLLDRSVGGGGRKRPSLEAVGGAVKRFKGEGEE
ncbi:hypothetical protein JCM6882_001708 [Rhodosporidiobolus microsporus]